MVTSQQTVEGGGWTVKCWELSRTGRQDNERGDSQRSLIFPARSCGRVSSTLQPTGEWWRSRVFRRIREDAWGAAVILSGHLVKCPPQGHMGDEFSSATQWSCCLGIHFVRPSSLQGLQTDTRPLIQAHALWGQPPNCNKPKSLMWLPESPMTNTLPAPQGRPLLRPLADPVELNKAVLFLFALTDPAFAREPRSTLLMDPKRSMCPRSCLCLPLPWPLCVTPEGMHVLPPGPVSNRLYFNFSCMLLNWDPPSDALYST